MLYLGVLLYYNISISSGRVVINDEILSYYSRGSVCISIIYMYISIIFPDEKHPLSQLLELTFILMTAFLNLKQCKQGFCSIIVTCKLCAGRL